MTINNPNNPGECCERQDAIKLANLVLDRVNADPDDDLAILARQFLREIERSSAPKDTQSTACYCHFFSEPHYHARDNPVKVSYDWLCPVHGQQHREWDIEAYEAGSDINVASKSTKSLSSTHESDAPPPTGAQERWSQKLDELIKRCVLGHIDSPNELKAAVLLAITAAYEKGRDERDKEDFGGVMAFADFAERNYQEAFEAGAAAHHKRVVEMIQTAKNYYNPIGDEFNKGRHAAWDALLTALTTIDPEKKETPKWGLKA